MDSKQINITLDNKYYGVDFCRIDAKQNSLNIIENQHLKPLLTHLINMEYKQYIICLEKKINLVISQKQFLVISPKLYWYLKVAQKILAKTTGSC